ncbi:unnamed protein product, partial [Rotaria sordida]
GRIGDILEPVVDVALGSEYIKITFYVYSAFTIIEIILIHFLPETRNRSFHTDEDEENDKVNPIEILNETMNRSIPAILRNNRVDISHTRF